MTLREVVGTVNEPVSLADAKEHLRISHTEEDNYILLLITTARRYLENELGEAIHSATYDYYLDDFPSGDITLPIDPLISVTHVKYYDADNVLQTLVEDTDYRVDSNSLPGVIEEIGTWPFVYDRTSAVQIRFTAGPSDFSDIDPLKIHAMKLKIALDYGVREGSDKQMREGLENLILKLRKASF